MCQTPDANWNSAANKPHPSRPSEFVVFGASRLKPVTWSHMVLYFLILDSISTHLHIQHSNSWFPLMLHLMTLCKYALVSQTCLHYWTRFFATSLSCTMSHYCTICCGLTWNHTISPYAHRSSNSYHVFDLFRLFNFRRCSAPNICYSMPNTITSPTYVIVYPMLLTHLLGTPSHSTFFSIKATFLNISCILPAFPHELVPICQRYYSFLILDSKT